MAFTNAYERTLDAKNRIQIPAPYRQALEVDTGGGTFYLCPGERRNTLSLYSERAFEERAGTLRTDQISGEDSLAFEQLYYSLASRLEMDKQGRVVLPERLLSFVKLGKEIVLAGSNMRIDVWKRAEYEDFVRTAFVDRWADLQKFMRIGFQAPAEPDANA